MRTLAMSLFSHNFHGRVYYCTAAEKQS